MSNRLQDKVALVTGAGSIGPGWGNGKAAAVLYAREGAKVVAIDCNLHAAEETSEIIRSEGGECLTLEVDVTDSDAVAEAVNKSISAFGKVDILHNNVGVPVVGGPEEITEAVWDRQFQVNVKSMFLTCKNVLPHMVQQKSGSIVNISSIGSIRYFGYACASYAAGKGAVNQLTQQIAIQYAPHGIRANSVLPGLMHTPQIEHYVQSGYDGELEDMLAARREVVPMKMMGDAWDVARASLFLASDEARYITGVELPVDGGITCKVV